jgi:hypothetical protein
LKLQKHKQFFKINADDSDVTDVDSDEEVYFAWTFHISIVWLAL